MTASKEVEGPPNNGLQRTALRAAAEAERWAAGSLMPVSQTRALPDA